MIRNPSLEYKEMRDLLHKKFLITYVMKYKFSDDSYDIIKRFCQNNNINIICREYDSNAIIEDQENIISLPAIHVYVENIYSNTYHDKDDFIKSIQHEIKTYEIKEKKNKLFKHIGSEKNVTTTLKN